MAETKQKWLKTDKLGRKIDEIWRKRGMLAIFCFCTFKLSNSFLPNCQFLFCQATQCCSAKLNIFARGGQGPPAPPPRKAYDHRTMKTWSCMAIIHFSQTGGHFFPGHRSSGLLNWNSDLLFFLNFLIYIAPKFHFKCIVDF